MKINIKTSLTIESNNKNFLKTKEFPKKGYDSLLYVPVLEHIIKRITWK